MRIGNFYPVRLTEGGQTRGQDFIRLYRTLILNMLIPTLCILNGKTKFGLASSLLGATMGDS